MAIVAKFYLLFKCVNMSIPSYGDIGTMFHQVRVPFFIMEVRQGELWVVRPMFRAEGK